jgi:MFS family permease
MLGVLRDRNFALLWCGGLISSTGSQVLSIALPFFIYQRTHSVSATGAMFVAGTVPNILFGSVAGVFVDRWDRRRTMIVCDLTRAVLLLLLLTIRSQEGLWVVYVVAFVETSISTLFGPAEGALLPHLVRAGDLIAANALVSFSGSLSFLVGPPLGGALLGLLGLPSVVLLDSVSYLFSAVMIALIRAPAAQAVVPGTRGTSVVANVAGMSSVVWRDWLDGLRLVRRDRLVVTLLIVVGVAMAGQGIINVTLVAWVKEVLRGGSLAYGVLGTAQAVGGLLGPLIIGQVGAVVPPTRLLALGSLLAGLLFVLYINVPLAPVAVPVLPLVLVLAGLTGVPSIGAMVSVNTLLQSCVLDRYRGRVLGTWGTTTSLAMLAGMGAGSCMGTLLGVVAALDLAAGLFTVAGLVALVVLPRTAPTVSALT